MKSLAALKNSLSFSLRGYWNNYIIIFTNKYTQTYKSHVKSLFMYKEQYYNNHGNIDIKTEYFEELNFVQGIF